VQNKTVEMMLYTTIDHPEFVSASEARIRRLVQSRKSRNIKARVELVGLIHHMALPDSNDLALLNTSFRT